MFFLDAWQVFGFLMAAGLITLAPGPDNLMVLALGLARGARAGIAFGLGCAAGCLSHTTLAALGLGALVAATPAAFTGLKIAGGLYLLWLGIKSWRAAASPAVEAGAAASPGRLFRQGLLANAVNPKVILFFLAFLPQFVDPGRGAVAWQLAALGVIFTLQAGILFSAIGLFAGRLGAWLGQGLWLGRLSGVLFIGLGLRLAFG